MVERPDDPGVPLTPPPPGATDPALAVVELDEMVRPHSSASRRTARAGVVLVVLLVVVGLLLHRIGSSPPGTAAKLPNPPPRSVIIVSNVNFGSLTVNGHTLPGAPPLVTDAFQVGTNVVSLAAPPFGVHTCHVRFPNAGNQPPAETGCSVSGPYSGFFDVQSVSVVPDQILDIELSETDLPPDLAARAYATALQAVAAIRPHTVVPVGQYYATGRDGQGRLTAQPATAPMQAEVIVDLGRCAQHRFCHFPHWPLGPSLGAASGQHVWSVGVALTARWRFTPQAGQAVLSSTMPAELPLHLLLAYDGTGGWSALTLLPSPATTVQVPGIQSLAEQLIASLCQAGITLAGGLEGQNGYGLNVPDDRGVGGCAIQLQDASTSNVQGTFLWRFGVLLAVDKGAHALGPWLPIAPQAEVAAVEG